MKINNISNQERPLVTRLRETAVKLLSKPVALSIDGHDCRLQQPRELDFVLAARCGVPTERVRMLYLRGDGELNGEATRLRETEARFGELLEASQAPDGIPLHHALLEHESAISKDHGWRQIFSNLLRYGRRAENWLQRALTYYLKYLGERREVIGSLLLLQTRPAAAPAPPELRTQTVDVAAATGAQTAFRRLPQGKPVSFRLARGESLPLTLARHTFILAHEADWELVADDGQRYTLCDVVNSVGRSRENTVRISPSFRNISRKHLIAQLVGENEITLTDLSSSGTFVLPVAAAS